MKVQKMMDDGAYEFPDDEWLRDSEFVVINDWVWLSFYAGDEWLRGSEFLCRWWMIYGWLINELKVI